MDFDTFKEIVGTVKTKYPHFFELEHDKIPTMKDVIAFQEQYQISLPEKYIQFCTSQQKLDTNFKYYLSINLISVQYGASFATFLSG